MRLEIVPGETTPVVPKVMPSAGETSREPTPEEADASQSLQIAASSDKMGGEMIATRGERTGKRE